MEVKVGVMTKINNGNANKLNHEDRHFHDWYRFVLSFPPHLVRDYIKIFGLNKLSVVLDPFCGTGTTLVEAKLAGMASYGIEANNFAKFASQVKTDWEIDPEKLLQQSSDVAEAARYFLHRQGLDDFEPFSGKIEELELRQLKHEETKLLLTNSISPLPLHKVLVLFDYIQQQRNTKLINHQLLALANVLVYKASNLNFGPEVGVGKIKTDVPVISLWLAEINKMAKDIRSVTGRPFVFSRVFLYDARCVDQVLSPNSIDAVITSPPYPNEKDYTRITRLESVVLGFMKNKLDLRLMKKGLIRSNTRNVYKGDDDDKWIDNYPEIQRVADLIEARRIELEKTSGFERLYSRVTKLYFGGMARHLASLRPLLRPNAQLAYVVGDQASYLRVMIRTGQLLGEIAETLGYEVVRLDLFRTRLATATKEQLREEVLVLRWKGN